MRVQIYPGDICSVKLTEHGKSVYSRFCKEYNKRLKKEEIGFCLFQCPEPELKAPLYWIMLIFGKYLHSPIHNDSAKKRVFQDGIHFLG